MMDGDFMNAMYVDIETCPIQLDGYEDKEDEEKQKLINPIDSRVVAIGVKRADAEPIILMNYSEKQMLEEFWKIFGEFKKASSGNTIVGFNIKSFDIPFLVTRSFINKVKIYPFYIKEIIDLREYLTGFRFGKSRGTLKEFGEAIGVELIEDTDGSKIAFLCKSEDFEKIKEYLLKDLELTEKVHKMMITLDIDKIRQW